MTKSKLLNAHRQSNLKIDDGASPKGLLPKKASHLPPFTLVLDLDETLIHCLRSGNNKDTNKIRNKFNVRPYAIKFLNNVSEFYEVVIFTAAIQLYADPIIDDIDPCSKISHRLYRNHTKTDLNSYIKDLALIGRSLESTIIVDNIAENFRKQKENGIHIRDFYGDSADRRLKKLSVMLIQIAKMKPTDIRNELVLYKRYIEKHIQ